MPIQEPAHHKLSVTQRIRGVPKANIKGVKQPRGGYLPIKQFHSEDLGDGGIAALHPENISPSIVGLAVDYLTRLQYVDSAEEAFPIARQGMEKLPELNGIDESEYFNNLMHNVKGLDDNSIIAACQLAGFDSVYRAGFYSPIRNIIPDQATIANIQRMVERCKVFVQKMDGDEDVICGPTFKYGYTDTVAYGDADLCTASAMCDIKTSTSIPDKNDTLQVFMYFLLGWHDGRYDHIDYIALFNPRINTQYYLSIYEIDAEIRREVELEVLGYSKPNDNLEYISSLEPISKEELTRMGVKFK